MRLFQDYTNNRETIPLIKYLLYDSLFDEQYKWDICMLKIEHGKEYPSSPLMAVMRHEEEQWDKILLMLRYWKDDSTKILKILFTNDAPHRNEYGNLLINLIVNSQKAITRYIIKFILTQTGLSEEQKWSLFNVNTSGSYIRAIAPILTFNNDNLMVILEYFDPQRNKQSEIKQWFPMKGTDGELLSDTSLVTFLRYFKDDMSFIMHLINSTNIAILTRYDTLNCILNMLPAKQSLMLITDILCKHFPTAQDYKATKTHWNEMMDYTPHKQGIFQILDYYKHSK